MSVDRGKSHHDFVKLLAIKNVKLWPFVYLFRAVSCSSFSRQQHKSGELICQLIYLIFETFSVWTHKILKTSSRVDLGHSLLQLQLMLQTVLPVLLIIVVFWLVSLKNIRLMAPHSMFCPINHPKTPKLIYSHISQRKTAYYSLR